MPGFSKLGDNMDNMGIVKKHKLLSEKIADADLDILINAGRYHKIVFIFDHLIKILIGLYKSRRSLTRILVISEGSRISCLRWKRLMLTSHLNGQCRFWSIVF